MILGMLPAERRCGEAARGSERLSGSGDAGSRRGASVRTARGWGGSWLGWRPTRGPASSGWFLSAWGAAWKRCRLLELYPSRRISHLILKRKTAQQKQNCCVNGGMGGRGRAGSEFQLLSEHSSVGQSAVL